MKCYLFLIFLLLSGCGGTPSSNTHHNSHANSSVSNANSTTRGSMDHGNSMGHGDMQSSPEAASAPFDLQFIDTMTAHHQGAVDMAMLAETRAQHPELKELAANIINGQEREIAKMSKWRDSWFGEKAKAVNMQFPGMSHGMSGMDLKRLESLKGNEFDLEFIRQMIPHHEGAVEMANALRQHDSQSELKELAADIIEAQASEIKQMRDWYAQWENEKK